MIGLLLPLRWMLYQGATPTPVYGDAPEQRYVWAPPVVTASEVFPIDPQAEAIGIAAATVQDDPTFSVVTPEAPAVVPPFEPLGIA